MVRTAYSSLALSLLIWASAAAAQVVPACPPGVTFGVTLTSSEDRIDGPLVATHNVTIQAQIGGTSVKDTIAPPAGVRVTGGGKGGIIAIIVPVAASVPMTVSWQQSSDPASPESDPEDPAQACAASRVVSLPILPTRPTRAVKAHGWQAGYSYIATRPDLKRPDLSPLEITARITSRADFPTARNPVRTMVVPMREEDQITYKRKLPNLAYVSVREFCRVFAVTCGSVFTEVGSLDIDRDALDRGVVQGDIKRGGSTLAFTQPYREAVRYGAMIEARPGSYGPGKPRRFGYDVQIRQSGRLIARVRAAGRCAQQQTSHGVTGGCKVRRKTELH
jgi:hypothetical protein